MGKASKLRRKKRKGVQDGVGNILSWAADRRRTDTADMKPSRTTKEYYNALTYAAGTRWWFRKTFRTHGRSPPGQTATTMYLISKASREGFNPLGHTAGMNLCKMGHAGSTPSPRYGHTTRRRSKG